MATYTARGNSYNVIYSYRETSGKTKQHWETYSSELEAIQRKAYIDYLQKVKNHDELQKAAIEYRNKRADEKAAAHPVQTKPEVSESASSVTEDNTDKTYREFADKWLPFQARKNRFSPNTYDSYTGCLKNHILPYFGDMVMSTITSEDVDDFVDYLSKKPCMGSAVLNKNPDEIPTLSSGTVKKCYNILTSGFHTAKKWRYMTEIPETTAPIERWKKRKAWDPERVASVLAGIKEDATIHLAIHIAFVCSLRAGEVTGIDICTIDFHDRSFWIYQQVQRVSDEALKELPKQEILRVFPKQVSSAKTSLILKGPKTEGSRRKQYLTTPLLQEIKAQLEQIKRNKEILGPEYQDYGLLICQPDGRPVDPKSLDKEFKKWQNALGITDQIEFQGLRKSGQMHKVRLTKNNYQLVAENSGQSPEVLMSNYNEALDSEKRTLALLVETSFYSQEAAKKPAPQPSGDIDSVLLAIQSNPELSRQILQSLLLNAVGAQ